MAALAFLLAGVLLAALPGRAEAGAGEACREQARIAEQAAGIPDGLLLAIGKRESGRFDPQAGGVLPWPWTVNREGADHVFAAREEAVAYVAAAQREGSRSVDVGCFQINLMYHPTAFASLEEAFDPAANATYAARFLTGLHDREGSWETAVAYYHSATPWHGVPYREAVFATWHGLAEASGPVPRPFPGLLSGIRIWVAGAAQAATVPEATMPMMAHPLRGLPRVVTPSVPVSR